MKSRTILLSLILLLIMILALSCGEPFANSENIPGATRTSSPGNTTPTITLTLPPTETTIPSPTLTAIPTLPIEDARIRLFDLLAKNGGCHLPCLWGITPGKSTNYEAQTVLVPLDSISELIDLRSSPGVIEITLPDDDLRFFVRMSYLYAGDGIVNRISLTAWELQKISDSNGQTYFVDIFNSKSFGERLSNYMLPQILSEQGAPAAVVVSTYKSPIVQGVNLLGGFDIFLLYPDQGLFVHYTTQMQLVGSNVRGCMADAHVEMELFPEGKGESYSDYLASTQWANLWPVPNNLYYKPIESASSMSVEQFYRTFRQPTDACLETPANLWPIPG